MKESIALSVHNKMFPLLGAEPGQLIVSPSGDLALTALWEDTNPDPNYGVYVPLVGENAFHVQWIENKYSRAPNVLQVEGCEMLVHPSSLSAVPVGFDVQNEPGLALGGLFFTPDGARILVMHDGDYLSLSLAKGTFTQLDGQRRQLGASEWTLELLRNETQCFSAAINHSE